MANPPTYHLFVGVDIAAKTFTVSWTPVSLKPERPLTLPNTAEGGENLRKLLLATGIAPGATLVVLEATSSYWVALAVELHTAHFHVSVVNPAQVRYFAKS